jgi:pimeloyl-ACP methyl ester carboxylesterase
MKHPFLPALLLFMWMSPVFAAGSAKINLRHCQVPDVPGGGRCGTYDVFENRSANAGRKISLNILVLPAVNAPAASDPVFWLEGGPGGAATQAAGPVSQNYLRGLRKRHDLVFVDGRGTGKSSPLKCDDIGEDPSNFDRYFGKLFPPNLIRACREKLEQTADLTLYTTAIAMDDLDEVRNALGYERINIAAASYGTLAAQVYIGKYPQHVRSAFLVGVVTPGFKLPLPFARAAQNALEHLFQDCAADQQCHDSFPNLKHEFYAVLTRFDHGPLDIELIDPTTQAKRAVRLERENYVEHLRALLYSTATARFLPLVVHQAFLNNFVPFGTMATRINLGGPQISRGLYFSATCAEAIPFIGEQEIVAETSGSFLGDRRVRAHIAACAEWPKGKVPNDFIQPIKSEIPVVMFVGDADGAAPPWIAEAAVKLWPNGLLIKAAHTGHQIDGPCTWNLMEAFIRAGSVRQLDTSCVEKTKRPPFASHLH